VEERLRLQEAEHELFSKLILATARLAENFEDFKARCSALEAKLGHDREDQQ
jgi:hypothetical protein